VQNFKVPHLRNAYAKVGMFSAAGNQVRGVGFLHDGSVDTLTTFLSAMVFDLNTTEKSNLQEFVLRYPGDLAPIVGQQVTLTASNSAVADPRIALLEQRALTSFTSLTLGGPVTECDLIAKGTLDGAVHGWVYQPNPDAQHPHFRDDYHALNDNSTGGSGALHDDAYMHLIASSQGLESSVTAPSHVLPPKQ